MEAQQAAIKTLQGDLEASTLINNADHHSDPAHPPAEAEVKKKRHQQQSQQQKQQQAAAKLPIFLSPGPPQAEGFGCSFNPDERVRGGSGGGGQGGQEPGLAQSWSSNSQQAHSRALTAPAAAAAVANPFDDFDRFENDDPFAAPPQGYFFDVGSPSGGNPFDSM
jgi:hypothetical protein